MSARVPKTRRLFGRALLLVESRPAYDGTGRVSIWKAHWTETAMPAQYRAPFYWVALLAKHEFPPTQRPRILWRLSLRGSVSISNHDESYLSVCGEATTLRDCRKRVARHVRRLLVASTLIDSDVSRA